MSDPQLLQELLDREAIKELKARYFRLADAHDWEGWRQVFTDDVHGEFGDGAHQVDGADAVVEFVSGVITHLRTVHQGHDPELTLDGPNEAHGTWAFADYLEWPADPETGDRRSVNGFGRYYESYRKVEGQWKISRIRIQYRAVAPQPKAKATHVQTEAQAPASVS